MRKVFLSAAIAAFVSSPAYASEASNVVESFVSQHLTSSNPNARKACQTIIIRSVIPGSIWAQKENVVHAAHVMAVEAEGSLRDCLSGLPVRDAYSSAVATVKSQYDATAKIFDDALRITSPEEASVEIIQVAGRDYIDPQHFFKLATIGGADRKSVHEALSVIKARDEQTYKNLSELLRKHQVI